jgi:hypothetical protein
VGVAVVFFFRKVAVVISSTHPSLSITKGPVRGTRTRGGQTAKSDERGLALIQSVMPARTSRGRLVAHRFKISVLPSRPRHDLPFPLIADICHAASRKDARVPAVITQTRCPPRPSSPPHRRVGTCIFFLPCQSLELRLHRVQQRG